MEEFRMNVRMANAAFEDDCKGEMVRILMKVTEEVARGRQEGPIFDVNGNRVGEWEITGP